MLYLPSLQTPTLVIHDRDDRQIPWSEGEALAAALPNAIFVKTEKLGHLRLLRDPEVIRRATRFAAEASAGLEQHTARTTDSHGPASGRPNSPAERRAS